MTPEDRILQQAARAKENHEKIDNILEDFLENVYPPFKVQGFSLSEAFIAATLHDMECELKRLRKLIEDELFEDEDT